MIGILFEQLFHENLVPSVNNHLKELHQEEKALLLLEMLLFKKRLVSHDGSITVKLFTPKTISIIQPMDQGVILLLKGNIKLIF